MSQLKTLITTALENLEKIQDYAVKEGIPPCGDEKNWSENTLEQIKRTKDWLEKVLADCEQNMNPSFEKLIKSILEKLALERIIYRLNPGLRTPIYRLCGTAFSEASQYIDSYGIMQTLAFGDVNTVVVEANGSGKTTLACQLQKIVSKDSGIVIGAQRVLLIPKIKAIHSRSDTQKVYEEFDHKIPNYKQSFNSDIDNYGVSYTEQIGKEFTYLIAQLVAEKTHQLYVLDRMIKDDPSKVCEAVRVAKSTLDELFDEWKLLFPDIKLTADEPGQIKVERLGSSSYEGNSLSDGEKAAFYLIGRVLLAPRDSMIIIDEPELHLHKSIVSALWDRLELKRPDCTFFYFTHDIDFAVSRDAKKLWIKNFEYPNKWKFQEIKENVIPEELYLKILGSQRKVLFCEGTKDSWDFRLFNSLFPEYLVEPVGSCNKVRRYTEAFNSSGIANVKCVGIIDKDLLEQEEISELERKNIFVLGVAEIENIFLLKELLEPFAQARWEEVDFIKLEGEVLEEIRKGEANMLSQAPAFYATKIFSKPTFNKLSTVEDIATSVGTQSENGMNLLREKVEKLKSDLHTAVEERNYGKALEVAFDKGLITIVKTHFNQADINVFRGNLIKFLKSKPAVADALVERIGLKKLKRPTAASDI